MSNTSVAQQIDIYFIYKIKWCGPGSVNSTMNCEEIDTKQYNSQRSL